MVNNLFYFDRGDLSTHVNVGSNTAPATFLFQNNLWYAHDNPAQSAPSLPVTESGAIVGQDPMLLDAANDDYHIPASSPAAGKGVAVPDVAADHDGTCYGAPPSVGAFEAR